MKEFALKLGLTEKDLRSVVISLAAYLVAWLISLLQGSGHASPELMLLLGPLLNKLRAARTTSGAETTTATPPKTDAAAEGPGDEAISGDRPTDH